MNVLISFYLSERENVVSTPSPDITSPGLDNIVEKCPQRTGAHPYPEAAEAEHEGEGSEDVDPEVDDDDDGEDVDSSVTILTVSSGHPDCSCH